MPKILKVSSRDGTFVRGGISFPPAPAFVELNIDDMDSNSIDAIKNESALIIDGSDSTVADKSTITPPTVKELKIHRDALLSEITSLSSADNLEILEISNYTKGNKKSDVEDDISSLKQILSEVKDDKATDTVANNEPSADDKE